MILRLTEMQQRESSKERRADYGAAIARLIALALRLTEASKSRAVGLPRLPAPASATPTAKPPQPALPLGPVIVRARKPKPR